MELITWIGQTRIRVLAQKRQRQHLASVTGACVADGVTGTDAPVDGEFVFFIVARCAKLRLLNAILEWSA